MSIAPVSKLWLGAEVSRSRGRDLITAMMKRTARCCTGKVLLVTDGLVTYIKAVKKAFSFSEGVKGKRGRPRLIFPQTIFLVQVVKSYSSKGKTICMSRSSQMSMLLWVFFSNRHCTQKQHRKSSVHRSLSSQLPTTPAMTAGITDHLWSVKELLEYKVRPQQWIFKGRGRRSKKTLELIEKWGTF